MSNSPANDTGYIEPPEGIEDPGFTTTEGHPISERLARVLMRKNRIAQKTDLWYTTRKRMITCSDIAAVLGLNKYSTRNQIFKKKTGQSMPFQGNEATRRGNILEAEALQKYVEKTENPVWHEDAGLLTHRDWPCIGGSPDGITLSGILVEIKCPLTRDIIPGYVPEYYVPQVQCLMEIFDLDKCHFVQYRPATRFRDEELDITEIQRDRDFWRRALPQLLDFMQEVADFYEQAHLPIGTPMIDFERKDPAAEQRKRKRAAKGKATVCAFVDDPEVGGPLLIMEQHRGSHKPVKHTEYQVVKNDIDFATVALQWAQKLRGEPCVSETTVVGENTEKAYDESFFDLEAIRARMQAAASGKPAGPAVAVPSPLRA